MAKKRLDVLLVEKGLAVNRSRAQSLIMSGNVFTGVKKLEKAGENFDEDIEIFIKQPEQPFVSRGGMKLAHAIKHFNIEISGKKAIDVGSSTGGFTDCLLQLGAESVVALDVGKGQLDWTLRNDSRVVLKEEFNARGMTLENTGGPFDIAVIDVSFISLELILKPVCGVIAPGGSIIALVKPQFEVGKKEASKGRGIIRDPKSHQTVIENITAFGISMGLACEGFTESPITGAKGNKEFLIHFLLPK